MRDQLMWFARQRWRAWIETSHHPLKQITGAGFARQRWRAWIETHSSRIGRTATSGFARQRWRAWIETSATGVICGAIAGSPVSDGGRGLKQVVLRKIELELRGFARQRWRAWIETSPSSSATTKKSTVRPSAMAGVD